MDFQHRAGGRTGGGAPASAQDAGVDRRERLRQLALETIDLNKDPYFMRNHVGTYECKLCLTLHNNEGSYLAHTQGKKHQSNLARRAAREASDQPFLPAPQQAKVDIKRFVKIGRPGYKVTRERDINSGQLALLFQIDYPEVADGVSPRHRFMSAYEQKLFPPEKKYQYLMFAAEPYETIAFKIPSKEVDRTETKFWTMWNKDTRQFFVQFCTDLCIGGLAAAASKTIVAPIERIKLLLQVQYSHKGIPADKRYAGIIDAFSRVRAEQGLGSLWRGNATNVMRYFPTQALNFAFNDLYKSIFVRPADTHSFWSHTARALAAGGCAGSTTLCFVYPLDFIRTRLSVDIGSTKATREYSGFVDCFRKTVKSDGVAGLYRGFAISIQTYFLYRSVYFGMYEAVKNVTHSGQKHLNFFVSYAIAHGCSICSAYLTYPWDTVRRRMMIKGDLSSKHAFESAKLIVAREGVRGLFKGGLANVFRATGGALVMAIYQEIKKYT